VSIELNTVTCLTYPRVGIGLDWVSKNGPMSNSGVSRRKSYEAVLLHRFNYFLLSLSLFRRKQMLY